MRVELGMKNGIVRIKHLMSDLNNIVDSDYNGDNGEEFCREDTLECGYKSDLAKDLFDSDEKELYDTIEYVINQCYNCYYSFIYNIEELRDGKYYVSVAYNE